MRINRSKLIIFSIIVVLGITFSGYLYYLKLSKNVQEEREDDLISIAQLKIGQITSWFHEREADVRVLSQSPTFCKDVDEWIMNPSEGIPEAEINERISIVRREYHYEAIFIASVNGEILFSSGGNNEQFDEQVINAIRAISQKTDTSKFELYRSQTQDKIHLDFFAPILNETENVVAVLIFRVDPNNYLYPLIQTWPTPSETSETLLIREEADSVLFLNELRHMKGTALSFKLPLTLETLPEVMAVKNETGIVTGIDYRGKKVIAYIGPVPDTNWFIVSKVDREELFAQMVSRGIYVIIVSVLVISLFGFVIAYLYRNQQIKIFRQLWETEEEFKTTLYSIDDGVITTDMEGNIKQINAIAEKLTGWKEKDAIGKQLDEVFNIVNEKTYEDIINPAIRVIKEGVIVGLANHSILISKQGIETPIDDSAAPIRNDEGKIIGVVLVFRDQSQERKYIEEIESARKFSDGIVAALHESLLVLDAELNVVLANQAFYNTFNCSKIDVADKPFFSILDGVWDNKLLREQLEAILPNNTRFDNFEMTYKKGDNESLRLNLNARRIKFEDQSTQFILLAIIDITEKNQLIEELVTAKEQAEESDRLKTAFLANMSHEIRTPLNGILGFSSLVAEENLGDKQRKEYFKIVEASGQRLLSIVNDILDISLIQSNQIKIRKTEFSIHEFIQELFTFYSTLQKDKLNSIELLSEYKFDDYEMTIVTDKDRLFQIFKNLMDNAFKFTTSGYIRFGVRPADDIAEFYVEDSGPGIPIEKHDAIFDKFLQINSNPTRKSEGTGLGLSIAKGLVEYLGGRIGIESAAGEGACFYFTLPLSS